MPLAPDLQADVQMGQSQVKGIPFLVFDAGGVLEMFDPKEFSDNVVFEPTLAALKRKLAHVVERGRIKTVQLAEHITTGRQQWLQWHADFAESLPRLIQVICCLDGHMHRACYVPSCDSCFLGDYWCSVCILHVTSSSSLCRPAKQLPNT